MELDEKVEETNRIIYLMKSLKKEINLATDYIESVIIDYNNRNQPNSYFSDVLLIEDYKHNSYPKGELRKALYGRHGLYVFVLNCDYDISWKEISEYSSSCKGAGFLNWNKIHLEKGKVFYQGSTTNLSLLSRMGQHYSDRDASFSAMKLNHPKRIFMKDKLYVIVFPIKKELETVLSNYDFLIKQIEAEMHKRIKAYTGSKRV